MAVQQLAEEHGVTEDKGLHVGELALVEIGDMQHLLRFFDVSCG